MTSEIVGYAAVMTPSRPGGGLRGVRAYLSGPPAPDALAELLAHGLTVAGCSCEGGDLDALLGADLVVLLPGWETSPDCMIDVLTAEGAGIDFLPLADLGLAYSR